MKIEELTSEIDFHGAARIQVLNLRISIEVGEALSDIFYSELHAKYSSHIEERIY